jgi:hypothetical protein
VEPKARHALFALRLAVYGTTALLAVGVYLISAHQATPAEPRYGVQLNGSTQEAMPAYAVTQGGRVRGLRVEWKRFACSDGARFGPLGGTFNDAVERFHVHGRAFSVVIGQAHHRRHGDVVRMHIAASGRLSSDGRSARGRMAARVTLVQGGRVRATCTSGPFGWHVSRSG